MEIVCSLASDLAVPKWPQPYIIFNLRMSSTNFADQIAKPTIALKICFANQIAQKKSVPG